MTAPPSVVAVADDDDDDHHFPIQRYNSQLPPSYQKALHVERILLLRALHVLAAAIENPPRVEAPETPDEALVSEAYQHSLERDLASLEKGLTRFVDLKHILPSKDLISFFKLLLRASLTPTIDIGLRARLARCASRLICKPAAVLPDGIPWRRIVDQIQTVHIDCVDGVAYLGRDLREAHCRSFVSLLSKTRFFLPPHDSAQTVWEHFWPRLSAVDPDVQFGAVVLLTHILPTMGDAWSDWVSDGMKLWQRLESSNDWDSVWMTLFARLARHQPCLHDWTPYLPWFYTRIEAACSLPLGAMAPQGSVDRRCPPHICFLMEYATIPMAARFIVYSLSPQQPSALHFLQRFVALIANYFHPSNAGRWSGNIGLLLAQIVSSLLSRVTAERQAGKAGRDDRVIGNLQQSGVAPVSHRLNDEYIDKLIGMLMPLIELGLHSKQHSMSVQAATAARDLAIIKPDTIIQPLLEQASEGLESISSPHRTSAALRLLATMAPVFLDPQIYPAGIEYLPQALVHTLPGIDPNDPGKTEATLRFVAGVAARIQGLEKGDRALLSEDFLDDYMRQFLDRIFSLLDTLEAPAKKTPSGGYTGGQPLSYFILATTVENLFVSLPTKVAVSAARKVAEQVCGASCMNAMKYYATLVRTAAATVAAVKGGSSVDLFVPKLLDMLIDDEEDGKPVLTSVGEEELVWRIRMLAQACRCVGAGLDAHLERISTVIRLSFDKPTRSIYKAGGRLLRGVLEGLTSIQMKFEVGDSVEVTKASESDLFDFEWNLPSEKDWKSAEEFLMTFVQHAEEMCVIDENTDADGIASKRDILFRVLRLLHATQRGGRWLLSGAMPDHFRMLDKYTDEKNALSKRDAKLILKRPIVAGLGGERDGDAGREYATKLWARIYKLALKILSAVTKKRPDDGALLYRCLEPLELAHESFRRGGQGRHTLDASRSFKSSYKPVIAMRRPFGMEGGVGRAMPRFIIKLRIEAHHEMRLTIAARAGICCSDLCEDIVAQLTDVALDDFPRVRGEARGVLTRALRIVKPDVRRREIARIITALRTSASKASNSELKDSHGDVVMADNSKSSKEDGDAMQVDTPEKTSKDVEYETIMGASAVLRSSAAAPLIMRDVVLFPQMMHALLEAMPNAERPDAAQHVGGLFSKLSSLVRPIGIDPIRLVEEDLVTVPEIPITESEKAGSELRLKAHEDLGNYMLGILETQQPEKSDGQIQNGTTAMENESEGVEVHWRVKSLVAVILFVLIREDRFISPKIAEFFVHGSVSDVVALRFVCQRAVALMLAINGRKAGTVRGKDVEGDDSPSAWAASGNKTIAAIGNIVCSPKFAKLLVDTLALDHDEDGESRLGSHSFFAMLAYSRIGDGETFWLDSGGRPWPTSWTPRSRDSLNLLRVRLYEGLVRVYGKTMIEALAPYTLSLITKLETKQEKIISGVKDEDVRVLAGELLAGMCRGLDLYHCVDGKLENQLFDMTKSLLSDMTGPMGNVNGASLIRMLGTADECTIGRKVMRRVLDWQLEDEPLIVPLGKGPLAHLQARRLRFIHSCVADIDDAEDEKMKIVVKLAVHEMVAETGFNHELKTVREEVGRLLSLLAVNVSAEHSKSFESSMVSLANRLASVEEAMMDSDVNGTVGDGKNSWKEDKNRKSRSRQGETLSRFISIVYWNGRAREFEKYLHKILPSLFRSFDESDPERISHARMALSLMAQGAFCEKTIEEILVSVEETVRDKRWKVRSSVLGFLQIFSFCSLFTASEQVLGRVRDIVLLLLSDSQLEVRQTAAAAFVTMIRDSEAGVVEKVRNEYLGVLKKTTVRRRGGKKIVLEGEKLFKRHGAVLVLSSMVISSPYTVPEWMPSVLVALAGCVNDTPPISTGVRDLFGDFMRTHRDEWQVHKKAFTPEELEIVEELLVSPSYYA